MFSIYISFKSFYNLYVWKINKRVFNFGLNNAVVYNISWRSLFLYHVSAGFLPEELDKLFVKYVYPVFTPSVGLFVAGTTAYGVLKYLQNEKLKDQS